MADWGTLTWTEAIGIGRTRGTGGQKGAAYATKLGCCGFDCTCGWTSWLSLYIIIYVVSSSTFALFF